MNVLTDLERVYLVERVVCDCDIDVLPRYVFVATRVATSPSHPQPEVSCRCGHLVVRDVASFPVAERERCHQNCQRGVTKLPTCMLHGVRKLVDEIVDRGKDGTKVSSCHNQYA